VRFTESIGGGLNFFVAENSDIFLKEEGSPILRKPFFFGLDGEGEETSVFSRLRKELFCDKPSH